MGNCLFIFHRRAVRARIKYRRTTMQAIVFGLAPPLLPLFLRKLYKKDEQISGKEYLFRYVIYTFFITLFTTLVMAFVSEEGISFLAKTDGSAVFSLKYLAIQLVGALALTVVEWGYDTKRLAVTIDTASFQNHAAVRFARRAAPWGIFVLAALTVVLNASLLFDNVLWGDEAYTANLVRRNIPDMMYIITLQEPHPPLYYLWVKMWVELLGHEGVVFHFVSQLIFWIGLVVALTLLRKRYGKIPTAFFVAFSGMSEVCLIYNVEIRMYAIAFLSVTLCFYSAARLLERNRFSGWAGMVAWGLAAAYTHYFALLAVGVMMVLACLLAIWRYGAKTWFRAVAAAAAFILGYLPWLQYVFSAVGRVHGDWWLTESVAFSGAVGMIFGGSNMEKLLLPLFALLLCVIFFAESDILEVDRASEKIVVRIHAPKAVSWSVEACILLVGFGTIVFTLAVGYLMGIVYRPILVERYLYPLCGVMIMMIVVGIAHIFRFLKERQETVKKTWLLPAGKAAALLVLAALIWTGFEDYRMVSAEAELQSARTEETLALIGEPSEDMVLVSNGVKHIGWTVLEYYYPDTEIQNGNFRNVEADDFWYFNPDFLTGDDFAVMAERGYQIGGYGEHQIATYPFVLYHFFR